MKKFVLLLAVASASATVVGCSITATTAPERASAPGSVHLDVAITDTTARSGYSVPDARH